MACIYSKYFYNISLINPVAIYVVWFFWLSAGGIVNNSMLRKMVKGFFLRTQLGVQKKRDLVIKINSSSAVLEVPCSSLMKFLTLLTKGSFFLSRSLEFCVMQYLVLTYETSAHIGRIFKERGVEKVADKALRSLAPKLEARKMSYFLLEFSWKCTETRSKGGRISESKKLFLSLEPMLSEV